MQTVACFGDSLIYGFPFGPRISWLAEAEKLTGDKFLNYGVCGDCTDDILSRLKNMPLPAQDRSGFPPLHKSPAEIPDFPG